MLTISGATSNVDRRGSSVVLVRRSSDGVRKDTSDERREHHPCDEEYGRAQQDHIDHGLLLPPDLGGPPADRMCDASPKPCRRKQA